MKRIMLYGILIFIVSIGIGYYYSTLWKKDHIGVIYNNETKKENVKETSFSEEKLSYNATFGLKKKYKECGHFSFQYAELPHELINLTKNEISLSYKDWNIEEFSSNNLVLSQELDGYCDEHYLLKLGENNVEVYRLLSKNETRFFKDTNISSDYLTSTDINKLKEGIRVYGIKSLNAVIEDYE